VDHPQLQQQQNLWNGTSWTSNPTSMATGRSGLGGAGTQSLGLAFGGSAPSTAATEEWTGDSCSS
jgi:hypothetical protein